MEIALPHVSSEEVGGSSFFTLKHIRLGRKFIV